ncbi:MAG TPA: tetratricopeptide repeat protein [Anaerolineaceae bacterium]|nr:tetratricopeptide repeat protein [Anaerolineaceae bacterium]
MKQLSKIILSILIGVCLSACSSQVPTSTQPSIAVGALDSAEAYLQRGDQYFEIKDYSHAIADYSQAIRLKPDYAEAYNNRGFAYSLSSKSEMENAIADYTRAIQIRPGYAYAYNNRGVAYMASGHPDEALSDFNRAIQLQPDFPQAYSNRGNAYNRAGRIDLAIPDFLRAQLFQPVYVIILCVIPLATFLIGTWMIYRAVTRRRLARRKTLEIPGNKNT